MKVIVNGYGMLPFRATECHKFDGREDLVQFRGEVKLPKGVRTGGGSKWMAHDYWYTPEQITPTYNTAPSEADNFKKANDFVTAEILAYLFGPQCGGESCTNPNCSCKQGSNYHRADLEFDKQFEKKMEDKIVLEGLYKPTGLGENLTTTNNSGSVNKAVEKPEPTFEELEIERVKQAMQTLDMENPQEVSLYKSLLNVYQQLNEIYKY